MSGDVSGVTLERAINSLQSKEKNQVKQAIGFLEKCIKNTDDNDLKTLYERLEKPLLCAMENGVESCRERSVKIIDSFIRRMDINKKFLVLLIPVVSARMTNEARKETSEEVKVVLMELILTIVEKYSTPAEGMGHISNIEPFVDQLIDALIYGVSDPAPTVRRTACSAVSRLFSTSPYHCHQYTNSLVPPLIAALVHRHWKVRVSVIQALGIVLQHGDNKLVPEVTNPLARKLFDDNPNVRMAVVKVVGTWLLHLPDRYSFFPMLLPHILTCLTDTEEEVKAMAYKLWQEVGKQFISENEKDYKEKMNYLEEPKGHYPEGVIRPSFGCRMLVQREGYKFLPGIANELTDWILTVRLKAAQLLSQVTLHIEEHITQHIMKVLLSMTKAATDEDPSVAFFVKQSACYMGYFVPVDVYSKLIVENISQTPSFGELIITTQLISGSQKEHLLPHLNCFQHLISCSTVKEGEQKGQMDLVKAILTKCGSEALPIIGSDLWTCIVNVAGLALNSSIGEIAFELMDLFVQLDGSSESWEAHDKYCSEMIAKLKSVPSAAWTVLCHQQFIFTGMVTIAGGLIRNHIEDIIEILKISTSDECDSEVVLKMLLSVNMILTEYKDVGLPTRQHVEKFIPLLIKDCLSGVLQWKAGRSAQALRAAAVLCLKASMDLFPGTEFPLTFMPILLTLIADDCPKTRCLAVLSLTVRTPYLEPTNEFYQSVVVLVKRLDDCDNQVRALSICGIGAAYESFKNFIEKDPSIHVHRGLLEHVYNCLLIHLDDHDPAIQADILECLKTIAILDSSLLRSKICLENFRDKSICEKLISHVNAISSPSNQEAVPGCSKEIIDQIDKVTISSSSLPTTS